MADAITIKALQDASLDAKSLEEVVNGNDTKQVTTRLGENYPSVKKAIKTLFENGGLPATPFETKALMTASTLVDGDYAMVTGEYINNGLYQKEAGSWVKSLYDPVSQSLRNTADVKESFIGEKSDLKSLFLFEDNAGSVVASIGLDGNIVTPSANLNKIQSNVDFLNLFRGTLDELGDKVGFEPLSDNLFDFEDSVGTVAAAITQQGNIKINNGETALARSSIYSGEKAVGLYAREFAQQEYLNLNLQRLLASNTSTLSPFAGSYKQQFTIKNTADFLALKIVQGAQIKIDTPYHPKNSGTISDQVVHPYICKFNKTVAGYKHIMLITPFHQTQDYYENPCVYGSNDLRIFDMLREFKQPLADVQLTDYYNYNSDPCCVFDHATGEFCVINRNTQVIDGANISTLSAIRTRDFINWSAPQLMQLPATDMLSPSIIYDASINKWVMFGRSSSNSFGICTADSLTGQWSSIRSVTAPFKTWHLEVRYCGSHYIGIFGDHDSASGGALYIGISTDSVNWQFSNSIFTGTHLPAYKPSITHEFVDDNHIKFKIVWTSSDMDSSLANKWRLFTAETNIIEVI